VDTPGRLLRLLTLLSSRPWWTGPELIERLEITDRTLRRDITRLRDLGYPVEAVSGRHGGYRLGPAGRLPPLLLDDDEAVAVAVALRATSQGSTSGLETAALSALTKLDQVLPPGLRERVAALRSVTVGLRRTELPPVDLDVLVVAAVACRRPERMRFAYRNAEGEASERRVEPYRLVYTERRWYLVAFDLDRRDWRTFRVDRIAEPAATGQPFERVDPPDAAALVARGVALDVWPLQALIRIHAPSERVAATIAPTDAVIDAAEGDATLVRMGGEPTWIAEFVAGCPWRCEVIEPEEARAAVRQRAQQLVDDHLPPRRTPS
jgi:predicted DNA-binding transcriptional regulator YafY